MANRATPTNSRFRPIVRNTNLRDHLHRHDVIIQSSPPATTCLGHLFHESRPLHPHDVLESNPSEMAFRRGMAFSPRFTTSLMNYPA